MAKMSMTRSPRWILPHLQREDQRIQGIVGSIIFYACSVDSTFLVGLNSIVMQQTSAIDNTLKQTEDF